MAPPRLEIVVAHHNEDLHWLQNHESIARIYHKSQEAPDSKPLDVDWLWREQLDNVGMESHTYLTHLSQRYNQLADITLFTQGGIEATVDNFAGLEPMLEQALTPASDMVFWRSPSVFRRWDGMVHTYKWLDEYNSGQMRHASMSPGEFWRFVFGPSADAPPVQVNYAHEATFAVHRDAVQRHPREFYDRILSYFDALNHTRPEEGHYMERLWMPIFGAERRGVVLMPSGLRIPVYPPDEQVTFPDHATDGFWHG